MGPTQSCCSSGSLRDDVLARLRAQAEHWHERPVHPAGARLPRICAVLSRPTRITRAEAAELGVAKQLEETQPAVDVRPGYSPGDLTTSNSAAHPSR